MMLSFRIQSMLMNGSSKHGSIIRNLSTTTTAVSNNDRDSRNNNSNNSKSKIQVREIQVKTRTDDGSKAGQKLRINGYLPGVLYGRDIADRTLVCTKKSDVERLLRERQGSFMNTLLKVKVFSAEDVKKRKEEEDDDESNTASTTTTNNNNTEAEVTGKPIFEVLAIPRDLQLHPVRPSLPMALNYLKYDPEKGAKLKIPLVFVDQDESPALKRGAILNRVFRSLPCIVKGTNIPNSIHVSMRGQDIGSQVMRSQITIPPNVTLNLPKGIANDKGDFIIATLLGRRESKIEAIAAAKLKAEETKAAGGATSAASGGAATTTTAAAAGKTAASSSADAKK